MNALRTTDGGESVNSDPDFTRCESVMCAWPWWLVGLVAVFLLVAALSCAARYLIP